MNIPDFINYQKNKDIFTKETILSLWCSALYTFIFSVFIFLINKHIDVDAIFPEDLSRLFLLMFEGLIFLTLFALSKKPGQKEIRTFLRKRKLQLDLSKMQFAEIEKHFHFQGYVSAEYDNQKCLFLNNSSEGLITKDSYNNPTIKFSAKLYLHGFAFIVGAKDLENYIMFRINNTQENGLYISPHIRMNGVFEAQTIKEEINNGKKITDGDECGFTVSCKGRAVNIEINFPDKNEKQFHYLIPNYFGLLPSEEIGENIVKRLNLSTKGKIGFRAWGPDEKAIITKLDIKES